MATGDAVTDAPAYHSALDRRFGVPGTERPALAHELAIEGAAPHADGFESDTWARVRLLDAAEGFDTRPAVRGVLRRESDGRFLIFRYPFRDGTLRFVLPGGGADPGESPVQALEREVFEETGTTPRDLQPSGLLLFHLLASTIHDEGRTPTIQYSPIYVGTIDHELPDTEHREACWFSLEEFQLQPRRPISDPLLAVLRARDAGVVVAPQAVWLPA